MMPAYVPPQVYSVPQTPQKRPRSKKLLLWIGCGAAALVIVAVVLVLCLSPGGTGGAKPEPMLFMEDEDVYLMAGTETIQLDEAAFAAGYESNYLNAMVSVDGNTLYYLADVNSSSGEGDLMRIALGKANAEAESIAEDVYSARISADDKKVLYISDYEDGAGDLYLCTPGGKPEQIGESVYGRNYSFTPNAGIVYYTTTDGSGGFSLMQYSGGEETEIEDMDDASPSGMYMDDSGKALYKVYSEEDGEYTLYLYTNGKSERICTDTEYIYTYPILCKADEFLYGIEGELYYYRQGEDERVTDEFYGIDFMQPSFDPREGNGRHFMLTEGETSEDLVLYEVNLPGDPVKIGKMDGSYITSESGTMIAYRSNDNLYLVKKAGSGWSDREKICEDPLYASFDESGRYLYYIVKDGDNYSGDLCRVRVSGGEEEVLMSDVTEYFLTGSGVYAIDDEYEAYFVMGEDDSESIEEDIYSVYNAAEGVYLSSNGGELYYYNGGEGERISRDASVVRCNGYISGQFD